MSLCPKCGYSVGEGFTECPSCGVILAKVRATAPPPPPPLEPASPYAPPTAPLEAAALSPLYPAHPPAAATGAEISPRTLEALVALRPWLRFLVIYGFVALILMGLGALGSFFAALRNPNLYPIAFVYGFYSLIGLVFLLPLNRSVQAIRGLPENGPRRTLESFVAEQGVFWRRTGLMTVIMLCLVLLGLVLALVFGGMAAMMR